MTKRNAAVSSDAARARFEGLFRDHQHSAFACIALGSAAASGKQGTHTLRVFCGTGVAAPAGAFGQSVHPGNG